MNTNFQKAMRTNIIVRATFVSILAMGLAVAVFSPSAAAQVDGKKLLEQMVRAASKEKELVIGWPGSITPGREARANEVFNKRFGLKIKFVGSQKESTDTAAEALLETQQGLSPTFDVLEMPDIRGAVLIRAKAVEKIDNWEALLKALDPTAAPKWVSPPGPLQGYAFSWGHRQKVILYNTKMISEEDLPKTRLELANPKFKGKFSLPPWVSDSQFGTLVYPMDKWLEAVRGHGRNSAGSYTYTAGLERMLLGEFPFLPGNADYYFRVKKKDPTAPIGIGFFRDLTFLEYTIYLVRKGSPHMNAAKLFTLWAATSEANQVWENEFGQSGSLALPSSTVGAEMIKVLEKKNVKLVSWWDSPDSVEKANFYNTAEGKQYAKTLGEAQRGK